MIRWLQKNDQQPASDDLQRELSHHLTSAGKVVMGGLGGEPVRASRFEDTAGARRGDGPPPSHQGRPLSGE